ncbi:MAG: phosphate ABC transporter, permease protein PstA [Rhodospirillaceae bacterium]|nr:MAG: phosphate ABC transporter, permease protein PstA [Rhodospirillaceae bacterium]
MTDPAPQTKADATNRRRVRRVRAERRFRLYCVSAVFVAIAFLLFLIGSLVVSGYSAIGQTHVRLDVTYDAAILDPDGNSTVDAMMRADYGALIRQSLMAEFPDVEGRRTLRRLFSLVSSQARFELRDAVLENPAIIGTTQSVWLTASGDFDMLIKGDMRRDVTENQRRLNDRQIGWIDQLVAEDAVAQKFNTSFFTHADSRTPEVAGIWGAVIGSFYTMAVTLLMAFPIGLMTGVYLQEFATKNRWARLVEVNINNLAAVPSIVFGLLGLAVFLNFGGMPRSAPLVGGITLALMTLPTIIIATRASLLSVPPSIREAARGVGASETQVVLHHVLPLAMPGILTGTIIGMARALGETAPLLMIGMVAFIADVPQSITDPATALPVQIFLWADSPERAFVERTAAATLVLLMFLITMNGLAIFLRKRFERRW